MALTAEEQRIVQEVHDFVKKECKGFSFHDEMFETHIMGVRNWAEKLALACDADLMVCLIAAYLHDIHYIQTGDHSIHEIEGAKFARKYLEKFEFSQERKDLIAKCIENHRGSKTSHKESVEEKIIASADAMDHIMRYEHMIMLVTKDGKPDPRDWVLKKVKRGWAKIELDKGREMIRAQYEAAIKDLEG